MMTLMMMILLKNKMGENERKGMAARRGELDCRVPSAVEEAPSPALRLH